MVLQCLQIIKNNFYSNWSCQRNWPELGGGEQLRVARPRDTYGSAATAPAGCSPPPSCTTHPLVNEILLYPLQQLQRGALLLLHHPHTISQYCIALPYGEKPSSAWWHTSNNGEIGTWLHDEIRVVVPLYSFLYSGKCSFYVQPSNFYE